MGSGRACGKVILAGEHAVVYGVPAVAIGIDRGATATARKLASGPSRLRVATWSAFVTDDDERDLGRALAALCASAGTGAFDVEAETELPAGGGLGCSAALGVAIARAITGEDDVRAHAMAWERVFHGNPSGIDAAVATLGGAFQFARDGGGSVIERVTPLVPLVFAIGHSGVSSSTRAMVESVARQRAERPAVVDAIFERIGGVVAGVRVAVESGDRASLGALLDENHSLLAGLSLSTPAIDGLCAAAREAGAAGAKLTGAGGGGCVVALCHDRAGAERVLAAWRAGSRDGFVAELHAPSRGGDYASASRELATT